MFSQVKHHDHGDRARDQVRLTPEPTGFVDHAGRFARIAAGRAGKWPGPTVNPGSGARRGGAGKLSLIPFW